MAFDQEFLKKWVAALRSGTYKQTKGYLRVNDAMCCLGVACDLIDPDGWESTIGKGIPWTTEHASWLERTVIPAEIAERLGFSQSLSPGEIDASYQSYYAEKNDDGWTFDEIADELERVFLEEG